MLLSISNFLSPPSAENHLLHCPRSTKRHSRHAFEKRQCKKHWAFHLEKKTVGSCRAASQPIPLFAPMVKQWPKNPLICSALDAQNANTMSCTAPYNTLIGLERRNAQKLLVQTPKPLASPVCEAPRKICNNICLSIALNIEKQNQTCESHLLFCI